MLGPNQALWVYELENGGRKQGAGCLQDGDMFCCLGVACEVLESPETPVVREIDDDITGDTLIDQRPVMAKLGIRDDCGIPDKTNPRCDDLVRFVRQMTIHPDLVKSWKDCTLTTLNDDKGLAFFQIASVLRRFPELYFTEPR